MYPLRYYSFILLVLFFVVKRIFSNNNPAIIVNEYEYVIIVFSNVVDFAFRKAFKHSFGDNMANMERMHVISYVVAITLAEEYNF